MNINFLKPEPDCVDPSLNEDSGLAAAYDLVLEQGDSFEELTPESRTDISTSFSRSDSFSFEDSRPILPPVAQSFLRQDSAVPSSTLHYGASSTARPSSSTNPIGMVSTQAPLDNHSFNLPPLGSIMPEHDRVTGQQNWSSAGCGTLTNGMSSVLSAITPSVSTQPLTSLSVGVHVASNGSVKVNNNSPIKSQIVRQPNRKSGTSIPESRVRRLAIAQCSSTAHHPLIAVTSTNGSPTETPTPSSPLCAICGDTASGRHYGVVSCEGCKGFFKRSVRKQLQFTCRGSGQCPVDRSKRTRCQHCRFQQCLSKGMRREAVQEERHRYFHKDPKNRAQQIKAERPDLISVDELSTEVNGYQPKVDNSSPTSTCLAQYSQPATRPKQEQNQTSSSDPFLTATTTTISCTVTTPPTAPTTEAVLPPLSLTSLLTAELSTDAELPTTATGERVYVDIGEDGLDPLVVVCHSIEEQLTRLVCWARQLPVFTTPYFSKEDQLWLLRAAWSELLLISASFNSIAVRDGLLLANGRHLSRTKARQHGLGPLMDRFLLELVSRFREMGLERIELALLRAIILFNPDANNLSARQHVESVRESLYAGLHSYCTTTHPNDTSRFTKLLLRLPPLRSIAQKCLEHLFFVRLAAEDPSARRLINLVEHGVWPSDDGVFLTQQQHQPQQPHRREPFDPSSSGPNDSTEFSRFVWPAQGLHNHPVPGTLLSHDPTSHSSMGLPSLGTNSSGNTTNINHHSSNVKLDMDASSHFNSNYSME